MHEDLRRGVRTHRQRALDTIENIVQNTRAKLYRQNDGREIHQPSLAVYLDLQWVSSALHRITDSQTS